MSGSRDLPAIEGPCMGGMSGMSGMSRRAFSYDDNLEAPMPTLPANMSINNLWRRPIIPERKFSNLTEEEGATVSSSQTSVSDTAPIRSSGVVKTKASSIIMSSLITKQTHDSVYKFEQKAGLTDTSYTPHKGLTAEETQYHHRMPDSFQKMQIQSMEVKEEQHMSSAQSTPSNTPQTSPKQKRRSWFSSTGSELSVGSNSSTDVVGADAAAAAAKLAGGGGGGGGVVERWSAFGPRPVDQGSESTTTAGFALQAYRGAQKPSAIEVMKAQATRLADDAQKVAPPVMEIPTVEGRKRRPHKLKPRDMNILAPSGF